MHQLDPTQQRIVGVLIEKELAVPDTYPLTVNALLAGCNQKSNREPAMSLEEFEVLGALMALREQGWVVRVESGKRAHRFRHKVAELCSADGKDKAVLAELLLRGPQAAGALKSRVARLGFHGTPEEIETVLEGLRDRPGRALVELLPRAPRERDARWAHCLGERAAAAAGVVQEEAEERDAPTVVPAVPPSQHSAPLATPLFAGGVADPALRERMTRLEDDIAALRREIEAIRRSMQASADPFAE